MAVSDISFEADPGSDADDLDGHTIEELSDYLDRGRTPPDPSIEESPGCRIALDGLERLQAATARLFETAPAEAAADEGWLTEMLGHIDLEARAGRDIVLPHPDPTARLSITEGAVRGLLRAAGDQVPGVLLGRIRLDGDVSEHSSPIRVHAEAVVLHGTPIPAAAEALRLRLRAAVELHTELTVSAVDITIRDVVVPSPPAAGG